MKILTFQARWFAWSPHSKTQNDAEATVEGGSADEAVVAWLHVEAGDEANEANNDPCATRSFQNGLTSTGAVARVAQLNLMSTLVEWSLSQLLINSTDFELCRSTRDSWPDLDSD